MSAVPSYENSCIAPTPTSSEIWLVGVSPLNNGRLDAYIVDLTNIDTPSVRFIATRIERQKWSAQAQKACFPFGNSGNDPNSPVLVQQFGPDSWSTNVYPNGTVAEGVFFSDNTFTSPKLFSQSASVDGISWFSAFMGSRVNSTGSSWTGVRLSADQSVLRGLRDFMLSLYPTEKPLLSIGTFTAKPNPPSQGFNIVFDISGSGIAYSAVGNPARETEDRALTLANPQNVNMNGISLTQNAIPVTVNSVGYILDRASDGTTLVYSINPSRDLKLRHVGALSNVIPFSSSMVASYSGSRIVVYNPSVSGKAVLNTFDTAARVWNGPGLVKSQLPTYDDSDDISSKVPIGAIIGGVVGSLIVIAFAVFLMIRHRRRAWPTETLSAEKLDSDKDVGTAIVQQDQQPQQHIPFFEDSKDELYQQQHIPYYEDSKDELYQQQQTPRQSPQQIQQRSSHTSQPRHPQSLTYSDLQSVPQPKIYVPPEVYKPYDDLGSCPVYTQVAHSPIASTGAPYTLFTQTDTSSTGAASSRQYPQGYHS